MVLDEKGKVVIGLITLVFLGILIVNISTKTMDVEVIYFRNPSCRISNNTDKIMEDLKEKFKDKMDLKEIKIKINEDDENDTGEISEMRKKYNVLGVPTIIINGKEYTKGFTNKEIEREICKEFLIKPEGC